jgi:hypothetical protein
MIRWFGLIMFVLATALYAETQEEAYYRAMKLEEAGDITSALKAFEEAVALPGEYTDEIQGIIRDYKSALGLADGENSSAASEASPWEFHLAGELGLYGMHYKETGLEEAEKGGDLFLNVNPYFDYTTATWSHTFAASVQGDYFLNNDEMSVLDTNDWNLVLGLEYTLMGHGMLLDAGYDFNIEGKELSSDFYLWFEKDLFRFEKQRVGAVAWAYYQTSGPMSLAAYASWHRTVSEGLNGTVYVGAKFEADSAFDYKSFMESYATYKQSVSAYNEYWQYLSDHGVEMTDDEYEMYEANSPAEPSVESIVYRQTMGKWFGPVFRSRVSYKFKNRFSVEAKMNLFYGFAVGGPDEDFKKIKKFNGTWGGSASWKYKMMTFYLGLERNYKHMDLPNFYKGLYRESTVLTQLKLGVKWDI